ncbi:hypothetical protein GW764_00185 [Candidatus Parcubacteria bacterium]|nr:hypothetical protein [Candidatus Parcubacteria bacterium]
MKLNESFENNDQPNIDPELLLLTHRIKNFTERVLKRFSLLNPEDIELVKVILFEKQLKMINSDLNNRYDKLSDLSEKLIESDKANTPEFRKKREKIKNEINEIIDAQSKLETLMIDAEKSKILISMSDKKDISRAEEIVKYLLDDFNNTIAPRTDLN